METNPHNDVEQVDKDCRAIRLTREQILALLKQGQQVQEAFMRDQESLRIIDPEELDYIYREI